MHLKCMQILCIITRQWAGTGVNIRLICDDPACVSIQLLQVSLYEHKFPSAQKKFKMTQDIFNAGTVMNFNPKVINSVSPLW